MDEHFTDDDLRALRAADPAAGVEAPQALRDRVDGMPVEAAPVPLRTRRRWLVPAAAAVAVVAAIGGGFVWGAGGIDLDAGPTAVPLAVETGTPGDPAAPIGLGGGAGGGNGTGSGGGSTVDPQAGIAPQADSAFATADRAGYGWGGPFHRQRFVAPPFETTPGQASVYGVDGHVQFSAEDAARMAAALGITGDARTPDYEAGGWILGDVAGPNFSLTAWGGADAHYNSGVGDPWTVCHNAISPHYSLDHATQAVWEVYHATLEQCVKDTPMPTEEQAREALSLFLAATGVDEEATQITVWPDTESRTIGVTAARIVENNATGVVSSVSVSADGMLYGYGQTGEIVSLGEYPIVSAAEGASRLNDPAYSPTLVSWPETNIEYPEYTPPTAPPAVPDAGSAVPWSIAEREIVSARLGLALIYGSSGEQYLVPAYEFTAADETVWSVIALAEDELDTTTTPGYGFFGGWW